MNDGLSLYPRAGAVAFLDIRPGAFPWIFKAGRGCVYRRGGHRAGKGEIGLGRRDFGANFLSGAARV
jgi:hypothetical protein